MKLLILGAGFSGKAIARICGPTFEGVYGTTRSEKNFAEIAKTGVDYASSGWITHSAPNLDVALDIEM